jgi:hypothetical protein
VLDESVLEAVRVAVEQGSIEPDEALAVAAEALEKTPLVEAARTLVRFRDRVTLSLLAPPAQWSLIKMAGHLYMPSFLGRPNEGAAERRRSWIDAFELLVDVDLAGTLALIDAKLVGENDYDRMRAAAAAETLVEVRPEVAPVMARRLVAALSVADQSGPYVGEEVQMVR